MVHLFGPRSDTATVLITKQTKGLVSFKDSDKTCLRLNHRLGNGARSVKKTKRGPNMKSLLAILILNSVTTWASSKPIIQDPLRYSHIQSKSFAMGETGSLLGWQGCSVQIYESGNISIECKGTSEQTTRSGMLVPTAFACSFDFKPTSEEKDSFYLMNEDCQ